MCEVFREETVCSKEADALEMSEESAWSFFVKSSSCSSCFGLGRVVGDGNARRDEIVERKDSISFERASRRSRSSASEEE